MSVYQRRKGGNGEREVVNLLKANGIPAKRISMLESGNVDKGDIEIANTWKAEVKIGKMVPKWLYEARKAGEDILLCRRDRKDWLITMDLKFFVEKFL